MGKLARLNKEKKSWFVVAVKEDYQYEVEQEIDGQKVTTKEGQAYLTPLGTKTGKVLPFTTKDEAKAWLSELVKEFEAEGKPAVYDMNFRLLKVWYVPDRVRRYDLEWANKYVLEDEGAEVARPQSSRRP